MTELPEGLPENLNPPNSGNPVDVETGHDKMQSLVARESSKIFTCSDESQTGYKLSHMETGEGNPLCLALIEAKGSEIIFQWIDDREALDIRKSFSSLEDTPDNADMLQRLIKSNAKAVAFWAKLNNGAPLSTIPAHETTPQTELVRSFDYRPYKDYCRTIPLSEGRTVKISAIPEKDEFRVRFEVKLSNDTTTHCFTIEITDSGRVLEALNALPQNEEAGQKLADGIENRRPFMEILNVSHFSR